MSLPQRILFPTDFSECAERAWPVARVFAERLGAELELFHAVVITPQLPDETGVELQASREVMSALEESARERLRQRVEQTSIPTGIGATRAFTPAQAILDRARERDVDLIVMGTHGRGGLGRLVLGAVARDVLRATPCPVLTVRGGDEKRDAEATGDGTDEEGVAGEDAAAGLAGASLPPRRIAVGIDFSDHSARALRHAEELAGRFGASLAVAHVSEEALYPEFYYPVMAPAAGGPRSLEEIGDELEGWLRDRGLDPARVERHVLAGRAATALCDWVEAADVDLLVVGSHGRRGVRRMLVGSVAEEVIRRTGRPVLTVRPESEEEPAGSGEGKG